MSVLRPTPVAGLERRDCACLGNNVANLFLSVLLLHDNDRSLNVIVGGSLWGLALLFVH